MPDAPDNTSPTSSASESENPAIDSPQPKTGGRPLTNRDWWPERLDLNVLHQHTARVNPYGPDFDYAAEVETLDFDAVKEDVRAVLTDSKDWWPADFGHYGGLMIRLSWHAAGTYRISDGRGGAGSGMQRFAPLNSWPDNVSLDKARRLLWPVKQKYGRKLSWADLLVFAGNVALEDMGFETFGFAFGRPDAWEPEEVIWGPEGEWLGDERYSGERELSDPLGAVQMGLIYVNPEGPNGNPEAAESAHDIRETFARMAMDDEETVALIAGGHSFGKTHGAHSADEIGPEVEAAPIEAQGFGWHNPHGTGKGADAITSGLEVTWTQNPIKWENGETGFFDNLYGNTYELEQSPAGANQWVATNDDAQPVPHAHDDGTEAPRMLTSDLALKTDETYDEISKRFKENPDEFRLAFAKAWYKLLHRDMGPISRYRGPWIAEPQLWQDPVPDVDHDLVGDAEIAELKAKVLDSGLSIQQLVATAWASASSFRCTDKRGGANGARIRLAPQKDWESNAVAGEVIPTLEGIQQEFNGAQSGGVKISLADLIVLAGTAAVEKAAQDAGFDITVAFHPGRTDASQEQTDVDSFAPLELRADGFRNYLRPGIKLAPETLLLDRASLLGLTATEMTVLVGGMRALGANHDGSDLGVFTDRPGQLTTDFFVNLLGEVTEWRVSDEEYVYESADGRRATAVDLVFGSHSELRALAEVYASADAGEAFARDFAAAWTKVMDADRYDLA
ncbi:catalase/peroxidase HPI [Iamia sp. SCSIO 61187]|uniref:catalase/peroxidase HPI n=1 Tax=Iamia sp. SCSIO 61187 TaxID=2722752 RepID=UPI001C62BDBA|nr:catalase/peroxidase HPI [Iamia sp. SCSIO 61187]QYG94908.1 catalase/peroxidase HPI [Iamia sp. SCSIO 61187]